MPRPIAHVSPPENSVQLVFALLLGPVADCPYTEAQLRSAWEVRRDEWLSRPRRPGFRPWAHWWFDIGEDRPKDDAAATRLAELGLLREDEVAAIAERANEAKLRIGTATEGRAAP